MISVDFDIRPRDSAVRVAERGEENPKGYWESVELMDGISDASFSLYATDEPDEDDPAISVSMSFYHAKDETTGRVFHANMKMPLTRKDLEKLQMAVEMALKIGAGS